MIYIISAVINDKWATRRLTTLKGDLTILYHLTADAFVVDVKSNSTYAIVGSKIGSIRLDNGKQLKIIGTSITNTGRRILVRKVTDDENWYIDMASFPAPTLLLRKINLLSGQIAIESEISCNYIHFSSSGSSNLIHLHCNDQSTLTELLLLNGQLYLTHIPYNAYIAYTESDDIYFALIGDKIYVHSRVDRSSIELFSISKKIQRPSFFLVSKDLQRFVIMEVEIDYTSKNDSFVVRQREITNVVIYSRDGLLISTFRIDRLITACTLTDDGNFLWFAYIDDHAIKTTSILQCVSVMSNEITAQSNIFEQIIEEIYVS